MEQFARLRDSQFARMQRGKTGLLGEPPNIPAGGDDDDSAAGNLVYGAGTTFLVWGNATAGLYWGA